MTRITPLRVCLLLFAAATLGLTGCMRGGLSTEPPVHLVLDMDFQQKLRPQAEAHFEGWADGRASRLPVSYDARGNIGITVRPLVVAQDSLPDPKLAHKDAAGKFVTKNPLPADHKVVHLGRETTLIERGRERFDIHCAVCHGYTGQGGNDPNKGHGLVGRRWSVPIPNFHAQTTPGADNRVANFTDGEYFEVITNGKGTMPAYGARISPEDRWAIVHYIRALQQLSK